jgi:hypothetical protein
MGNDQLAIINEGEKSVLFLILARETDFALLILQFALSGIGVHHER